MKLNFSKTGIPCLWEGGGGLSNTRSVTLIADPSGDPKRPIYVRTRGSLACEDHALIPVAVGDIVVHAEHSRGDFDIMILEITSIGVEEAETLRIGRFSQNEWDVPLPERLSEVVSASQRKARDYHCRTPYFIKK